MSTSSTLKGRNGRQ